MPDTGDVVLFWQKGYADSLADAPQLRALAERQQEEERASEALGRSLRCVLQVSVSPVSFLRFY